MTTQRTCRGCTAAFTMTTQGQRYCAACRAEREAAQTAQAAARVCQHCGTQGSHVKWNVCPDCKAAKEAERIAAKPKRVCAKCGTLTHEFTRNSSWCWPCRIAENERQNQAEREARLARLRPTVEKPVASNARPGDSDYEHTELEIALMEVVIELLRKRLADTPATTDVNPEEQPHADQDDIDAAFGELMQGFDL